MRHETGIGWGGGQILPEARSDHGFRPRTLSRRATGTGRGFRAVEWRKE